VAGCRAKDTGRDLDALLNGRSASAVELLGGGVIAEGGWNEHAIRERKYPDVSYGFGQPSIAWCSKPEGLDPSADPRYRNADTPRNRELCKLYFWDAERAIAYMAPRYAAIRATCATALDAWCKWNKPAIPPEQNPNRAHYARSLAEAEQYRVVEEPPVADTYTISPAMREFIDGRGDAPRSDEMYFGADAQGNAYGSVTHGRDALYRWDAVDNEKKVLPFPK
jgi:hypothetical protein